MNAHRLRAAVLLVRERLRSLLHVATLLSVVVALVVAGVPLRIRVSSSAAEAAKGAGHLEGEDQADDAEEGDEEKCYPQNTAVGRRNFAAGRR